MEIKFRDIPKGHFIKFNDDYAVKTDDKTIMIRKENENILKEFTPETIMEYDGEKDVFKTV